MIKFKTIPPKLIIMQSGKEANLPRRELNVNIFPNLSKMWPEIIVFATQLFYVIQTF